VGGDVTAWENANVTLPVCTSVGGDVTAREKSKVTLTVCTSVGGDVTARENAKVTLTVCTSVGGDVTAWENANVTLPVCTSVGGDVTARENAKVTLPVNVKKNDPSAARLCRKMLLESFAAAGFSFDDGILAKVVSRRGPVAKVIICGKKEISYIVTNGDAFSHGKTLAEARDGFLYKIGNRDTTEFKSWTLDREVTKAEAIKAYRVITGACEGGVRVWMGQRETPDKITVQGIIDRTKGAYGSDIFAQFFAGVARRHSQSGGPLK
jgi:hypothetical protein